MEIKKEQIGQILIEGKTKKVFKLNLDEDDYVYILSKDRISAGDGAKSHELKGKAVLSTQTTTGVFEFLNAVGVKTHFVSKVVGNEDQDRAFIAKHCYMIPIEWVSRRIATGSYLKRHPHVKEGYRFCPPKLETFFKDDANHDPFWSFETLSEAALSVGPFKTTPSHISEMLRVTRLVFELLERVWTTMNYSLIDMKIEFGFLSDGSLVVADVIDNDSWRLWPNGDKRLMLDKQVYRNMDAALINEAMLDEVRSRFAIVAEKTVGLFGSILPRSNSSVPEVAILLGSTSDLKHAEIIKKRLNHYGILDIEIRICSAHKATSFTLSVIDELTFWPNVQVIICIAGRSNGLGPVVSGNTTVPVINCPPDPKMVSLDIWSSLRLPSDLGCTTILSPENAALAAAHIVANTSPFTWGRIRTEQCYRVIQMSKDDELSSTLKDKENSNSFDHS